MSTVVHLGNASFTYNNTDDDHLRRKLYFKGQPGNSLDALEKAILTALGIDAETEKALAPYLADFFKLLPSCSSDTSLLLSKQCELPHFVLWSILFANKEATVNRLAAQPGGTPNNLNIAGIQGLVSEIRSSLPSDVPGAVPSAPATPGPDAEGTAPAQEAKPSSDPAIERLFTLIFPEVVAAEALNTTHEDPAIRRLFTLILNGGDL
jgi:hypothetical protein